jgi:hypothetical protein
MHDLSDLNPAKLHMTVPTHFRRNNAIPGILVLHYADLAGGDVQTAQGSKFTRPLRPILDLIEADTVERSFIRQALRQALDRGLITRQQIRNTQLSGPARKIIEQVNRSCGGMHNGASTSFSLSASSFAREYNNGKYFPSSHNGTRSA